MIEKTIDKQDKPADSFISNSFYGLPLYVYIIGIVIVILGLITKSLPTDISGSILLLFAVGFTFGKIGDILPIWKDYLGGGSLLAFMGASFLVAYGILPDNWVKGVSTIFDKIGLLDLFISVIITSSILSIDRMFLAKAMGGFIPLVVAGTFSALAMAIVAGLIVEVPLKEVILNYAMPIMGGGNGAGAIPMSQMWGKATGKDPKIWYSSAIAVLTVANVIAIIFGALLNGLGLKRQKLTGNGEMAKRKAPYSENHSKEKPKNNAALEDVVFGLFIALIFYAFAKLLGNGLLPRIGPVSIHPYAWMVIILVAANALNLLSERAITGLKSVNEFMMGKLLYVFLAGVGITYADFNGLIKALSYQTVIISLFTVIGSVVGTWFFAKVVGFYEIDAAIAGGLCHVSRGGSGNLEVLGASKRLILMSYAQLATRLGGAMVLVLSGILFNMWAR